MITREYRLHCTLGTLQLPTGEILYTLERPWLNNERNKSCIPEGTYTCTYLERSASGKYKKTYHVQNVPDRMGILVHKGNLVSHTLGCILVGTSLGHLSGREAVLGSAVGMRRLRECLGREDFTLIVQ